MGQCDLAAPLSGAHAPWFCADGEWLSRSARGALRAMLCVNVGQCLVLGNPGLAIFFFTLKCASGHAMGVTLIMGVPLVTGVT